MSGINIELHWEYEKEGKFFKAETLREIIRGITNELNLQLDHLAFIFVDDEYLKKLHKKYLNDDTYTDVITFDLRDEENKEAEIYVSVDRANLMAKELNIETRQELFRYMVHGLLHLAGYDDKTEKELSKMKEVENKIVKEYATQLS